MIDVFYRSRSYPAGSVIKRIMEKFLKVGIVTAPFGVHGEMKVYPTTDDPLRFKKLKKIYWFAGGEAAMNAGAEPECADVESAKVSKDMAIIKISGIDTPEEAAKLKRREFYVDRENAVPLKKDEYYIADLIGMSVIDEEDNKLGTLKDVLQTGANDVYIVSRDGDSSDLLIPAIKECVLNVDVEEGVIKVHLLDGLADL